MEPWDFDRCSILSNIDEGGCEDRCPPNTASELNTFTDTFPDNRTVKFVVTITRCCVLNTSKSGDELISMKETCGLREGRAEKHYYIPVRAI